MPITWQTILGASPGEALRAISSAGALVSDGVDRLTKTLAERQAVGQGVADRARNANVQAYLDMVQGATTPEALATLQSSGQLDQLRATMDPRDLAAIRGADEARLTSVRNNILAGQDFGNKQVVYNSQDAVNQAMVQAIQTRDPVKTAEIMNQLPANHPQRAQFAKEIMAMAQANKTFDSNMLTADANRGLITEQTKATPINAEANRVSANASVQNAATNAEARTAANYETALKVRGDMISRLSALQKNTVGGEGGQETLLNDLTKAIPDKDKLATITRLTAEALSSNPAFRDLPVDVVANAVIKRSTDFGTGTWNPFDGGLAGTIASDLKTALTDPGVRQRIDGTEAQRAALRSDIMRHGAVVDSLAQKVAPGLVLPPAPAPVTAASLVAPTPVPTAAPAVPQVAAPVASDSGIKAQAALEKRLIALGGLKEHSPEVKNALDSDQAAKASEREARTAAVQQYDQNQANEQAQKVAKAAANRLTILTGGIPDKQRAEEVRRLKEQLDAVKKAK